jgi:hypothetical protein
MGPGPQRELWLPGTTRQKTSRLITQIGRDVPVERLPAVNQEVTGWLSTMSLDRALGASLAQQMIGTAQALTKMSPSAREDSAAEERASAIRQLGLRRQLPFPVSKMSQ